MGTRWEYALVVEQHTATQTRAGEWESHVDYQIWRPGVPTPEALRVLHPGSPAEWVMLLNDFGGEGWEYVESMIQQSTIVPTAYGPTEGSHPVRVHYTFRRVIA